MGKRRNNYHKPQDNQTIEIDIKNTRTKSTCWKLILYTLGTFFVVTYAILLYHYISDNFTYRLDCYSCQSVENLPVANDNIPVETDCWKHPKNIMTCNSGEHCGSTFQYLLDTSGGVVRKVVRSCTAESGDDCHQTVNNGILEIICICKKDHCMPIRYGS